MRALYKAFFHLVTSSYILWKSEQAAWWGTLAWVFSGNYSRPEPTVVLEGQAVMPQYSNKATAGLMMVLGKILDEKESRLNR